MLLHLVVAVLHHTRVRLLGLKLHVSHAKVRRGHGGPTATPPPTICPCPASPPTLTLVGGGYGL